MAHVGAKPLGFKPDGFLWHFMHYERVVMLR